MITDKMLSGLSLVAQSLTIADFAGCGCAENRLYNLFNDTYKRDIVSFYDSVTMENRAIILNIINKKIESYEKL